MGKQTKHIRVYEVDIRRLEAFQRVLTRRDGVAQSLADVVKELLDQSWNVKAADEILKMNEENKTGKG
jgi:hypothetical protein